MDLKEIEAKSDALLKCPRCDSFHTKFCYYNNYNFSQPRHFCKTCRRYWTLGGHLRNVPIGGGTRKSKKMSKPIPSSISKSPLLLLDSDNLEMLSIQRGFKSGIVAAAGEATTEGFGSLDHLATSGVNEGMGEISGGVAVDGGFWFKYYGLRPPFNY